MVSVQPTPFKYSSTLTYRIPSTSCAEPRYRTVFLVIGPYLCSVMVHFSGSIRCRACSGTISVLCLISKISQDAAAGSKTTISNSPTANCRTNTCFLGFDSVVSSRTISSIMRPMISLRMRSST